MYIKIVDFPGNNKFNENFLSNELKVILCDISYESTSTSMLVTEALCELQKSFHSTCVPFNLISCSEAKKYEQYLQGHAVTSYHKNSFYIVRHIKKKQEPTTQFSHENSKLINKIEQAPESMQTVPFRKAKVLLHSPFLKIL